MPEYLKIDFIRGSDSIAITKGRFIVTMLADNPYAKGPLPSGVLTPSQLSELLDRYQSACTDAITRDVTKMAVLRAIRKEYRQAMKNLAKHLEILANGDHTKLENLGFDLRVIGKKGTVSMPLVAPTLEMRHGAISGTMIAKMSAIIGALMYELHMTIADPNVEEHWGLWDKFRHPSKNIVNGLTAGQKYWFRSRAIGPNGEGPWSPPFPLISL